MRSKRLLREQVGQAAAAESEGGGGEVGEGLGVARPLEGGAGGVVGLEEVGLYRADAFGEALLQVREVGLTLEGEVEPGAAQDAPHAAVVADLGPVHAAPLVGQGDGLADVGGDPLALRPG